MDFVQTSTLQFYFSCARLSEQHALFPINQQKQSIAVESYHPSPKISNALIYYHFIDKNLRISLRGRAYKPSIYTGSIQVCLQQIMIRTQIQVFIVALLFAIAAAQVENCYILAPDSSCQQCSFGYTLQNNTCVQGQQNCKTFYPINGDCASCYVGYSLAADSSCQPDPKSNLLQGCARPVNDACLACSVGYYFNFEGNCQMIDTLCKYFNYASKRCGTCYPGYTYIMNQGKCVIQSYQGDSNCTLWQNYGCLLCDMGYYYNSNGYCVLSDPSCLFFDSANSSQCVSCHPAYALVNNTCIQSTPEYINVNCATYDSNNVCISCRYSTTVLNTFHICVNVNPLCFTFDSDGNCLSCYNNYELSNNNCVPVQQHPSYDLCASYSGTVCLACVPRAYFDSNHTCQLVSSVCQTYDASNGHCTSCYPGWVLNNGACSYFQADPNCQSMVNNVCKACYGGYFYNVLTAQCEVANSLCQTIDSNNKCLSCYNGYYLYNGNCSTTPNTNPVNNTSSNTTNDDPLCGIWSKDHSVCLICQFRSYKSGGKCQKVSDQCNTFNNLTGYCLTCYQGYILSGNACIISSNPSNSSSNNSSNVNVSNNCKTSNSAGACLTCYQGYIVSGNACIVSPHNCKTSDINDNCLTCYPGYTLTGNVCIVTNSSSNNSSNVNVSKNCKTSNSAGACLTCYEGFIVSGNACIVSPHNCKTSDSNDNCLTCYPGYTLTGDACIVSNISNNNSSNVNASNYCKTSDSAGACLTCYQGFIISGNACIVSPHNCKTSDANDKCFSCFLSYYLLNGICHQVDPLCKTFDYSLLECTECFQGYSLVNHACQL